MKTTWRLSRRFLTRLVLAAGIGLSAAFAVAADDSASPPALPPRSEDGCSVFGWDWDKGLVFELPRRLEPDDLRVTGGLRNALAQPVRPYRLQGRVGGILQLDGAGFAVADGLEKIPDSLLLRRFSLTLAGELFVILPIHYVFELDLVKDQPYLKQATLGLDGLPYLGSLTVGQFKPRVTLESVTPTRSVTFMERSAVIDAFAPDEKAGLAVRSVAIDGRLTWGLGVFADSTRTDLGAQTNGLARIDGRITGLAFADDGPGGPRLLHLGLSGEYVYAPDRDVRYRARPESRLAPDLVDTGKIRAQSALLLGVEAAIVNGPFSLQGEYIQSLVMAEDRLRFQGIYVLGSWFLTGESRTYDRATGAFSWVTPKRPVSSSRGGVGAWELGARYSYLDLVDGPIHGGRMHLFTAGVNWYLTRHLRIDANYILGDVLARPGKDGIAHIFQGRLQIGY